MNIVPDKVSSIPEDGDLSRDEITEFIFKTVPDPKKPRSPRLRKAKKSVKPSANVVAPERRSTPPVVISQMATKPNQRPFTVIDLFSGCGGLSLGLEQSGFEPLLFSEISPHAAETYIANRKDRDIIPVGDVYNLTDVDLRLLKTFWR